MMATTASSSTASSAGESIAHLFPSSYATCTHHDVIVCREIPQELIREAKGSEVNLNMEDHRDEEFKAPKKALKAFTGEGNRLGR